MPNESSGKDLQIICWSLLRQIALSWRNLRHKMSTSIKTVSFYSSFFLSSPGHFSVNDLFTVSKQLAIRFQRNFTYIHIYTWVVCGLQCKILLTSRMTLTFQGHNYVTLNFRAISRFLLDKFTRF